MMPIFSVLRGEAQQALDRGEQFAGKADLLGPMHLGFDDVDRAGPRIAPRAGAAQVVQGDERGHRGVDEGLRYGFTFQGDGVGIMWWPTLRTSIRLRPGRIRSAPLGVR